MTYSYWERFIELWLKGQKQILGWTNPDLIPLLNTTNLLPSGVQDLSSLYVPEPWWGNDGNNPLHCVVMNYNPGRANVTRKGITQHQDLSSIIEKKYPSYSALVKSGDLPITEDWHWKQRALPILEYLKSKSYISVSDVKLESHLSIEFIPWHTTSASDTYGYKSYINQNLLAVFYNCFVFAAERSTHIQNQKLQNKVIIRKSFNSVEDDFLKKYVNLGIGYDILIPITKSPLGDGSYCKFKFKLIKSPCMLYSDYLKIFPELNAYISEEVFVYLLNMLTNVEFICIWKSKRFVKGSNRTINDFPDQHILDDILDEI